MQGTAIVCARRIAAAPGVTHAPPPYRPPAPCPPRPAAAQKKRHPRRRRKHVKKAKKHVKREEKEEEVRGRRHCEAEKGAGAPRVRPARPGITPGCDTRSTWPTVAALHAGAIARQCLPVTASLAGRPASYSAAGFLRTAPTAHPPRSFPSLVSPSTRSLPPSTPSLRPSTLSLPPSTPSLRPSTLSLPPSTPSLRLRRSTSPSTPSLRLRRSTSPSTPPPRRCVGGGRIPGRAERLVSCR